MKTIIKAIPVLIIICVGFPANSQQFEELLFKSKKVVKSDLTLHDNVEDIATGKTDEGIFYLNVKLVDGSFVAVYFENSYCYKILHWISFKDFKATLSDYKNKAKNDLDIVELDTHVTAFSIMDKDIIVRFVINRYPNQTTSYLIAYH